MSLLVTFEGPDRMGKSTLIKEVAKQIQCTVTKEPGSPLVPENQLIRELVLNNKNLLPMQRELLFYADALGHKQALEKLDGIVLSDRGLWSHLAYVHAYMKLGLLGSDPDENYTRYGLCKNLIKETCPAPDAIVYLRGDLALMRERATGEVDAIESLGEPFYKHVINQYDDLLIAAELAKQTLLILDAKSSVDANCAKVIKFLVNLRESQICTKI